MSSLSDTSRPTTDLEDTSFVDCSVGQQGCILALQIRRILFAMDKGLTDSNPLKGLLDVSLLKCLLPRLLSPSLVPVWLDPAPDDKLRRQVRCF